MQETDRLRQIYRSQQERDRESRSLDTLGDTETDVSEIFSAPRVCPVAEQKGFRRGCSIDVTHTDKVTGKSWDLGDARQQNRLWTFSRRRSSKLLVVSFPSTTRSSLNKFPQSSTPSDEKECDVALLQVATKACRIQQKMGKFLILELPTAFSSWSEVELRNLLKTEVVQLHEIDQCECASSPAKHLTNLSHAAVVLARCREGGHRHAQLLCNGTSTLPNNHQALSSAFLDALRVELSELQALSSFEKETHRDEDDLHESEDECHANHWHELTGYPLDPHLVMRVGERELKKLEERAVYERVPRTVAMQDPESKFVGTRWVAVQKGEEVRCRCDAQEFDARYPRTDLFAGTPPLFANRLLVSMAATCRLNQWGLMALDVSCAFLFTECERRLYIELPSADPESKTSEYVRRLRKALYGTREAPQLWNNELRRALGTTGFQSSRLHPRVFNHWRKDVYIVAHMDGLLVAGPPSDLEWVQGEIKKIYEIQGEMLRHGGMVKFLGREIWLAQGGVVCASDPKHAQLLIDVRGLHVTNGTDVPFGPDDRPETDMTKEAMSVNEAKYYDGALPG